MANSFGSIQDAVVSNSALAAFRKKLASFSAFSTNFSADAAAPGDTVKVLLESYPNDAAATKSSHGAYTIQDADSTVASVSLGQPTYTSFGLDDVEVAGSSALSLETFGAAKGNHLANAVLTSVWGNITNANYGAAAFTGAASGFDYDDVVDIKDAMDDDDVPEDGRALVLSNAYATALLKDNTIQNNYNGSQGEFREGVLGRLAGFDVYSTNVLPANGENLVGFACVPAAMAVGVRYLAPQAGHVYSVAEPMTDPDSGLTIGVRQWHEPSTGVNNRVYECVFGSAVGQSAGLKRLVSA